MRGEFGIEGRNLYFPRCYIFFAPSCPRRNRDSRPWQAEGRINVQ